MKEIIKHLKIIIILIIIQFLLDTLFVFIYPNVNPIRATLIGFSALVILYSISLIPFIKNLIYLKPYIAFLPVYSSALFGALLVQADFVKSKSVASGIAHVVILVATYFIIAIINRRGKNQCRQNQRFCGHRKLQSNFLVAEDFCRAVKYVSEANRLNFISNFK